MKNPHIGSTLEEFLAEQEMLAEAQAVVAKRKVARQLADLMKKEKLTKDALAKRMKTSRAALDRLLDPDNSSVTLATLGKAACALGRTLRIELTDTAR
jgi:antitoxin HicB